MPRRTIACTGAAVASGLANQSRLPPPGDAGRYATKMNDESRSLHDTRRRVSAILLVVALIGAIAGIPAEMEEVARLYQSVPWWASCVSFLFAFVPSLIAIVLGMLVYQRTGLRAPLAEAMVIRRADLRRSALVTVVVSMILAVGTYSAVRFLEPLLNQATDSLSDQAAENVAAVLTIKKWKLAAFAISAGIKEELIFRFGFMSMVAWLATRLLRLDHSNVTIIVVAGVLSIFPFALAHLANAAGLGIPINFALIFGILISNGIVGLACVWAFARFGIETAILTHVAYDLLQLVVWPIAAS